MLAIVAAMYGLDVCGVSHHYRITAEPLWASVSIAVISSVYRGARTTKMAHGKGQYGR